MKHRSLTAQDLIRSGCGEQETAQILEILQPAVDSPPEEIWKKLTTEVLHPDFDYALLHYLFRHVFGDAEAPPAWFPSEQTINSSNLHQLQTKLELNNYQNLYEWSVTHRLEFWELMIRKLSISFVQPPTKIADLTEGIELPQWLPEAMYNIADSCFQNEATETAIVYQPEGGELHSISYGELEKLANRVANGLKQYGFAKGDAFAIDMPMTMESVAIYLGIVKFGGAVVSIADSLAPVEVEKRLIIADTKVIFTQDVIVRAGKELPLYNKLLNIDLSKVKVIVLPAEENIKVDLRDLDLSWRDFLVEDSQFEAVNCTADDVCNVLFSSGTTGDPKAIP